MAKKKQPFSLDDLTPFGRARLAAFVETRRERAWATANTQKTRLYFNDRVEHYDDQNLGYKVWLALPKGTRCAFRGAGDTRPVYQHDLVDVA